MLDATFGPSFDRKGPKSMHPGGCMFKARADLNTRDLRPLQSRTGSVSIGAVNTNAQTDVERLSPSRVLPIAGAGMSMFAVSTMPIPVGAQRRHIPTVAGRCKSLGKGAVIDAPHRGADGGPRSHRRRPLGVLLRPIACKGALSQSSCARHTGIGALVLFCRSSADDRGPSTSPASTSSSGLTSPPW